MWISSAEVALLGAFLCLDRIAVQIMISRPIVVGPIIGLMLHDPATGLITGAFVELLWIDHIPLGKYVPPNDTIAAVLITAGAILAGHGLGEVPPELIALSVLLFAPFAYIAKEMNILLFKSNEALSARVDEDAKRGAIRAIAAAQWQGMAKSFLTSAVCIFVFLVTGAYLLAWVYPLLPMRALRALTLTYCFIPILGVAIALNTIKMRGALPLFAGLFLVFMAAVHIL